MAVVIFENNTVEVNSDETVLDALLRNGHDVPYGCKGGTCQSCMMKIDQGTPTADSQKGLTEQKKQLNYFLPCSCKPESDLTISQGESDEKLSAAITEISPLNDNVIKLKLKTDLKYFPGQFVNLWRDDKVVRSYSLASVPALEQELEFHIRHVENGMFSDWLKTTATDQDSIHVQGPLGSCFYTLNDDNKDQPLLLAGIGTGLAPLYGIVRDALQQGHTGQIILFVGAKQASNLYLKSELKQLSLDYPNVAIEFVAQSSDMDDVKEGDIYQEVKALGNLKGYKVFLCGAESFVKKMKKQCFLAGANMPDILSDSFVHSASA